MIFFFCYAAMFIRRRRAPFAARARMIARYMRAALMMPRVLTIARAMSLYARVRYARLHAAFTRYGAALLPYAGVILAVTLLPPLYDDAIAEFIFLPLPLITD